MKIVRHEDILYDDIQHKGNFQQRGLPPIRTKPSRLMKKAIMGALKTHAIFHDTNVNGFHVKSSFMNREYQDHDLLKMNMRTAASRKIFTASEEYEDLFWLLLTDHVTTFPTCTTANYHQEVQMIPCILSLLMWNCEETWRPPRGDAITTPITTSQHEIKEIPRISISLHQFRNDVITAITAFSLLEASLHSKLLYLLHHLKGTIVRKKDMLFFINEIFFLGWKRYCVHRVIVFHSPFLKPHSEFYLPIFSFPLAVPFRTSQSKKQSEDISNHGESKALSSRPKQGIHPLFFYRE